MSEDISSHPHKWVFIAEDDFTGWIVYNCSECGLTWELKKNNEGIYRQRFCIWDSKTNHLQKWDPKDEPSCGEVKMTEALE